MTQMHKDARLIVKACEDQGFVLRANRKITSHIRIFDPHGNFVTHMAESPGDYCGWRNMIAALKRAGLKLPNR